MVEGEEEFGFRSSPSGALSDWAEIARHWHARNGRLVEQCGGADAPFVHGEHGNTHNFLLAAENCGISTLREVLGNRGDTNGRQGRLDAAMIQGERLDLVEAKFTEFRLGADGLPATRDLTKCARLLEDAQAQADAYRNKHPMYLGHGRRERRISLLFVAAHLTDFSEPADGRVAQYVKAMHAVPHEFMSWSFPVSARSLSYWGRHYPGVILLARTSATAAHE